MAIDPFAQLEQLLHGAGVADSALTCNLRLVVDDAGSRILALGQGTIQLLPDDARTVDGVLRTDAALLAGLCSGDFPPAQALMLNGLKIAEGDFALTWMAVLAIFSEIQRKI